MLLKPFVKWAGGKTGLLAQLRRAYPPELGTTVRRYCEPFVGGGAVLFDILSSYTLDEVYICDSNREIINVYRAVQCGVEELTARLKLLQQCYHALDSNGRQALYYGMRDCFNALDLAEEINFEKAALFIFLNRTCFNGLYRVNKSGKFNVPIGAYKKPLICDEANFKLISKALSGVQIHCGDYSESLGFIDSGTFVYIDPPYRPLSRSSSFTAYNTASFDEAEQIRLAEFVDSLDSRGARVLLSNSDPKNMNTQDDFFEELYEGFNIARVSARRAINSKAESRGKISELLISN